MADVSDVNEAEQEVERSKQQLRQSLHAVSESGTRLAESVRQQAKPWLVVGALVVGVVAVGALISAARGRRSRGWRAAPTGPTLTGTLARGAGAWLAQIAVKRLALELSGRALERGERAPEPLAR
jgi:hypothetical protein